MGIGMIGYNADGHQDRMLRSIIQHLPDGFQEWRFVPDDVVCRRNEHHGRRVAMAQDGRCIGDAGGRTAAVRFDQQVLRTQLREVLFGQGTEAFRGYHQDMIAGNDFGKTVENRLYEGFTGTGNLHEGFGGRFPGNGPESVSTAGHDDAIMIIICGHISSVYRYKCLRNVFNNRFGSVERNRYNVEQYLFISPDARIACAVEPALSRCRKPSLFEITDVILRRCHDGCRPAFYFYKMDACGIDCYQINFQMSFPAILFQHQMSMVLEILAGQCFTTLSRFCFSHGYSNVTRVTPEPPSWMCSSLAEATPGTVRRYF